MTPEDQIIDALTSHDAPEAVRRAVEALDAYDRMRLREVIRAAVPKPANSEGGEGEQEIG